MTNLNGYIQSEFETRFTKTGLYEILSKDFDRIVFSKHWDSQVTGTPRQMFGDWTSVFSAVPFYYLEYLTSRNPKKIYDLGCGWNIFKRYIPNIIGVGAEDPNSDQFHGDMHDYVDDDFIAGHQSYFESVFSINALHFIPLTGLQKRVLDFYSMLKPGGVGWIALNIQRMLEQDPGVFQGQSKEYLDAYVRGQLADLDIDYLVFDVDLAVMDEFMDGNIRLVMHKPV